jgi:sugar-specific transcriptional regulator TrmB
MVLKELRKIGLTPGELKVYQALLKIGECTKTSLAKESGVAPSNIYDIINRLSEKGMVSKVKKNGVSHFSPANPRHILDHLEEKRQEINEEQIMVESILPKLLAEYRETTEKVQVEVFYGWKGMKTIFEDLLYECKKKDTCYVFGASKGRQDKQTDRFFLKYSKLRADKGIETNIIFNEELRNRKERIDFFVKSPKYTVRFLDQITPTEIMTYKDKTCIIISTAEPLVIRITGKEATHSFQEFFKILWKQAKK